MLLVHPSITNCGQNGCVLLGPENVDPIVVEFTELTIPSKYKQDYIPISKKYELPTIPKLLVLYSFKTFGGPLIVQIMGCNRALCNHNKCNNYQDNDPLSPQEMSQVTYSDVSDIMLANCKI
jgi:hypothetical protein